MSAEEFLDTDDLLKKYDKLKAENQKLKEKLGGHETTSKFAKERRDKAEAEAKALRAEMAKLRDVTAAAIAESTRQVAELEAMAKPTKGNDVAWVDGQVFKVTHRGEAKAIFEEVFKKRYCDHDHTVLVIDRHGG